MSSATFIWQLSKREQLGYYKRIKDYLVNEDVYSYENLCNAMNTKIVDLPYEVM